MTPKTLITRVIAYLKALVWTGTANKIFGNNVFATTETPILQISQIVSPSAYLLSAGQTNHPEHHNIIEQKFNIIIFVENLQDNFGEGSILGACRVTNKSSGAGIFDIEAEILSNFWQETELSSAKIVLEGKSRVKMSTAKGNKPLIFRSLNFSARTYLYG